jgi:BASS family bile acid:Na+ symporter
MNVTLPRLALWLLPLAIVIALLGAQTGNAGMWKAATLAAVVLTAIGLRSVPALRSLAFTGWIVAALTAGMLYPTAVLHPAGLNMKNPWLLLLAIQSVMFGMGTQMSLADFAGVLRMPWPVAIGFVSQFAIMPLIGWTLTQLLEFPPEIAAGVILIGCCPSGLASNVMSCLARANLPLAVTITACTTAAAPLMTPLLMKLLAGELVEISLVKMIIDTVELMLAPIAAAFLHDWLKTASPRGRRVVYGLAGASAILLSAYALGGWAWLVERLDGGGLNAARVLGSVGAAILAGLAWHRVAGAFPRLVNYMPIVSMAGIVFFTAVTTAAGRADLLRSGRLLFLAAMVHNAAGYFCGYWLARLAKLDNASSRTVAFEVGMQNGGMGTGLAASMDKLSTMGLASAVFSPWMNITGSLLACWWRRNGIRGQQTEESCVAPGG